MVYVCKIKINKPLFLYRINVNFRQSDILGNYNKIVYLILSRPTVTPFSDYFTVIFFFIRLLKSFQKMALTFRLTPRDRFVDRPLLNFSTAIRPCTKYY